MARKSNPSLRHVLADNLRRFRALNSLSQEELADHCDLHRTYIGSVERAERNVSLSTLEGLAKVLGVSVPELLTPRVFDEHDARDKV